MGHSPIRLTDNADLQKKTQKSIPKEKRLWKSDYNKKWKDLQTYSTQFVILPCKTLPLKIRKYKRYKNLYVNMVCDPRCKVYMVMEYRLTLTKPEKLSDI